MQPWYGHLMMKIVLQRCPDQKCCKQCCGKPDYCRWTVVKKSVLDQKKNLIRKLVKGWLARECKNQYDPSAKKEANGLFAKGFKFPEDIAAKSADKVYFSTLGDNINFFGLNSTYTGMTGDRMYGTDGR